MKNKVKSIVLVIVMLASAIGIGGTVYYAKGHIFENNVSFSQQAPNDMLDNAENKIQPPDNNSSENNTAPQQPQDGLQQGEKDNSIPEMPQNDFKRSDDMKNTKLTPLYIAVIAVLSALFSISLLYLLMSIKNKAVFKNKDKIIIYILAVSLLTTYLTAGITVAANKLVLKNNAVNEQQTTQKDNVVLNEDNVVNSSVIDLSSYTEDVTISKGGTYELCGEFTKSVIVNAPNEKVELVLNNVKIENSQTAAIIGLSAQEVTVNLKDNTENILSDGGNSEYDGCIFSNAPLVFEGEGALIVNGNQNEGEGIAAETADITINSGKLVITSNDDGINAGGDGGLITINGGEIYVNASGDGIDSNKNAVINGGTLFVLGSDIGGDAGIDTDTGFVINGGTVVALGSDMLEAPKAEGAQNTLAFTLDSKIDKDNCVTLMRGDEVIISFNAPKSFKTILISSALLENGDYSLYTGKADSADYGICADGVFTNESLVYVNGQNVFAVNQSVSQYGKSR